MHQHNTEVICPVCKEGSIVAQVGKLPCMDLMGIMDGRPQDNLYSWYVTNFHCSKCGVLFHFPPGKPNAREEVIRFFEEEEKAGQKRKDVE